jgi:cell division protein FtsB
MYSKTSIDAFLKAVKEDEDGYLSVNYEVMIPILVEAFKQHLQEYKEDREDLKREINQLKQKLEFQGRICFNQHRSDSDSLMRYHFDSYFSSLSVH